jgi:hypothetical protein
LEIQKIDDAAETLIIQSPETTTFNPVAKQPHLSVREKVSRIIARAYRPARGKAIELPAPAKVRRAYFSKDAELSEPSSDSSTQPPLGNQIQQLDNQVEQLAEQMRTPFGLNAWLGRPV